MPHKRYYPHIAGFFLLICTIAAGAFLFLQSNNTPTYASAPTLTTVDSTGITGYMSSIAIGLDGFSRITYWDVSNNDLRFAQCTNASCSTKNLTTVESSNSTGKYSSVAIDPNDGFARISFFRETGGDLIFIQCTNADCSTKNTTVVDTTGFVGYSTSLVLGSDGFGRIAYFDNTNSTLKFAQCTNASCSANVLTTIDSALRSGSSSYIDLALGSDGFGRISYAGVSNSGLKYVQCTNADCSTNNLTTVDASHFGGYNSISLDTSNNAYISYWDDVDDDLEFVQCTNADCSTKNNTTIESSGSIGNNGSSLTTGSDGFARIAYYDSSNSALKLAKCTNASCSTNTLLTVDNTADEGQYNSLALGSDGFPRISYFDGTNSDLRFAQCTDATCGTPPNNAPSAPTTLYSNTYTTGAQSGSANPTTLDSKDIVVSAIHGDVDGNAANKYQVQVSTDNGFSSLVYDSGSSGTTMTSTANGARSPNIEIGVNLTEDTTYYWRIKFWDTIGDAGSYSPSGGSAASFKTSAGLTPSITTLDSTGTVGSYTSAVTASDGFTRISYVLVDTNLGANELRFIQCTNATCTTNVMTTVDGTGVAGGVTSTTIAADGFARIAYYDGDNQDLKFAQCTNAACSTNVLTTVDSTGFVGNYPSVAMASDGFARISYYDSTNGDLKFAQCTNAACSTSTITTVDSTGNVGTDSSMTLGSDGFARIAYIDSSNSDLKFAQCTNASCSSKTLTSVETTGFIFTDGTAIQMASDGFARITFANLNDFRFVQCTNDACSTNVRTSVGTVASSSGASSSLTMASDGFARITYAGGTNISHNLEFVKCTNAACSTKVSTTINGAGNVGQYSSLALSTTGYPRISYYDATNADLKFASCTNSVCTSAVENVAPTTPTSLRVNTVSATAQSAFDTADGGRLTLSSPNIVFSAIYADADSGDIANKYRLEIDDTNDFSSLLYDSGSSGTSITNITAGNRSSDITTTATIAENTTYYWRLKFWDDDNTEGDFSASGGSAASFKTAANLAPPITTIDSTGNVGSFTSFAIASADGFGRISYYDTTNSALKFVQCTNPDCSTNVVTTIDSTGDVGKYSSMSIASDGFARIAYYDDTSGTLKYCQCTHIACITYNIITIDLGSGDDVGEYASLALGADGFARIAYYDTTSGDLKFIQCTNASCSTKNTATIASSGNVGQYTSISMGAGDGFPRIAYYDVTNGSLKYVTCNDATCDPSGGTPPTITTVDSGGGNNVGQYTSLTIAPDGYARISYYDVTNSGLKYVQCEDPHCQLHVITLIQYTGNVGKHSSIKVAADGFARISYYDQTNGSLKYAQCTNASCANYNITTVDTTGDTGQYSSLSIGSNDMVRLSYYDVTNGNLMFSQCTNAGCSTALPNTAPSAPTTLYSNNQTDTAQSGASNPTNLNGDTLVFSALYQDSDAGDIASRYQLQISTDNTFATTNYDSGDTGTTMTDTTQGTRSPDIEATGFTPTDNTTYYWRIRFWDQGGVGTYSPSGGSAASFGYALPTISFDIDTALTDSESAAPYSISLGTLSPQTLTTSDGMTISSIFLDLTSNASNGATITVLGSHGGLYSASKAHTITLDTNEETIEAGQEKFGMCVASITKAGGTGLFTAGSTYDADGASNCTIANAGTPKIGKINTTETTIAQTNGTITGGRVQILTKASITTTTPAASDYEEVMTFIATGGF